MNRRWIMFALVGACVVAAALMIWRGTRRAAHASGPPPPSDGSSVEMSSSAGGEPLRMTLSHGQLLTTDRGPSIELFSQPISACRPTGKPDMVLRLPDDFLDAVAGTSVGATIRGTRDDADEMEGPPRFGHPNGGALETQQTTLEVSSIQGGRVRGKLSSAGRMVYFNLTKGATFQFRANGTIDVPICD